MLKEGPAHAMDSQSVVAHVLTQVSSGNISQAFRFTARGVGKPPGVHKSSTDWSRRMDWERGKVINGACSGKSDTADEFEQMVRERYATMLNTQSYRFVGETPAWQRNSRVVEHVVEVQTKGEDCTALSLRP